MQVVMVEALAEAMILVGMADLVRVMGHLVVPVQVLPLAEVVLLVLVHIKVAMMPDLALDMEELLVELPSMEAEVDMVVLVDIILMEDRQLY
jgi:hypothetical protein